MRRHLIGIVGIALVIMTITGAAVTTALVPMPPQVTAFTPSDELEQPGSAPSTTASATTTGSIDSSSAPRGRYTSLGEQIYFTGVGSAGPIPRTDGFGMMGTAGCVSCHGADGAGGLIQTAGIQIGVPDIRLSTLESTHVENGELVPAATEAEIEAAIRTGANPHGGTLSGHMPRWQMNDTDMSALIEYLRARPIVARHAAPPHRS